MSARLSALMVVLLAAGSVSGEVAVPVWSPTYTTMGLLSIPYAEIEEPFSAFYDGPGKRSRVDFYGGMDKTFQRGDLGPFGTLLKVIPIAAGNTEGHLVNFVDCFKVEANTSDSMVRPQSVLPNLDGFEWKGVDIYKGRECQKWQKKEVVGDKVNKYTMWLRLVQSELRPDIKLAIPLHYEMKGYNNLLGSHYDHYYLTYDSFSPEPPVSSVFDEFSKAGPCHGWPGPGMDGEHVYLMNPMREFVDSHMHHVNQAFESFKAKHDKSYRSRADHETRRDIFRQNMRYIHSTNRRGLTYKVAPNHMTDWTSGEMKILRGRLSTPGYNGGKPFKYTAQEVKDAPDQLDWRLFGAVSPVKDQSVCGSCWSFGTVGTLEGAMFLQTGKLTRLSQQALIDCSWEFGNNGCDGGEDFRVYKFMLKYGGIPSEEDYGPYLGNDGNCHFDDTNPVFQIREYINVTSGDSKALQVAIAKHGPISVGIDASHRSLSFYSNGVYYEPECKNGPDDLDHAVLAVGYGEMNGEKYWLIKNSWSTFWGNDGYVLMSQKDNNCGVATAPTFVISE